MKHNLGMAIEHKPAGKYDSEAERIAQPAGLRLHGAARARAATSTAIGTIATAAISGSSTASTR